MVVVVRSRRQPRACLAPLVLVDIFLRQLNTVHVTSWNPPNSLDVHIIIERFDLPPPVRVALLDDVEHVSFLERQLCLVSRLVAWTRAKSAAEFVFAPLVKNMTIPEE